MVKVKDQVYSFNNLGSEGRRVFAPGMDGVVVEEKVDKFTLPENFRGQEREF